MRDQFAPIIEGYDCDGITSPLSFRCERFYTGKGDNVVLLSGTSIHDVFPAKIRFSWALGVLTMAQYNALVSALDSGSTPDVVSATVFDPTRNTTRQANFRLTRPTVQTIYNFGQKFVIPKSELILEEVTPPTEGGNG